MQSFKWVLPSLVAAAVVAGSSLVDAAEQRSTIERRLRPGAGLLAPSQPDRGSRDPVLDICERVSGDRVRFVAGDAAQVAVAETDVKGEREVLATVQSGRQVEVIDVAGPWVAAQVDVDGKPVRGWIWHEHLRPANVNCS